MQNHTMRIVRTRSIADGKVVVGKPKTDRSSRELPIPDPVYSALLHARTVQQRERRQAGDKYVDSGYVFVDKLGRPVYPDYLTDHWKAACERAGVPVINLQDEGPHMRYVDDPQRRPDPHGLGLAGARYGFVHTGAVRPPPASRTDSSGNTFREAK